MKTLVVYYSRTGLTAKVAAKLVIALGAEVEAIVDKSDRAGVIGYLRSGREAMQKRLIAIEDPKINPADYDLVIIGTPVWAADMSSPVRAFLTAQKSNLKRVAFFVTQGGSGANRVLGNMADLLGLKSSASLIVLSREIAKDDYQEKLDKFVGEINAGNQ